MKKENNTYEFSKRFAIAILILTCIITIYSCILMYKTGDLSSLSILITAIFAELATSTGFYYSKAKEENKIKLKNEIILNTLKLHSEFKDADIEEAKELIENAEQELSDYDDA